MPIRGRRNKPPTGEEGPGHGSFKPPADEDGPDHGSFPGTGSEQRSPRQPGKDKRTAPKRSDKAPLTEEWLAIPGTKARPRAKPAPSPPKAFPRPSKPSPSKPFETEQRDSSATAAQVAEMQGRLDALEATAKQLSEGEGELADQLEGALTRLEEIASITDALSESLGSVPELREQASKLEARVRRVEDSVARGAHRERDHPGAPEPQTKHEPGAAARAAPRPEPDTQKKAAVEAASDINAADWEELREVGLSVTESARLLAARDVRDGFDSIDELDELRDFRLRRWGGSRPIFAPDRSR